MTRVLWYLVVLLVPRQELLLCLVGVVRGWGSGGRRGCQLLEGSDRVADSGLGEGA